VPTGSDRRQVGPLLLAAALLASCTFGQTPPTPAAKDAGAGKPAVASPSPSPAALVSPTPQAARPVVGGGAAQPRAAATSQPIGGSAAIIVPTPNFASQPTAVPAQLAPAVQLSAGQAAANVPGVTGTLTRLPTAIAGPPSAGGAGSGGGTGAAAGAAAAAATGGGGGGGAQTVPAVLTATPLVRIAPQPQPTLAWPPR
jgi:hypothetical protein